MAEGQMTVWALSVSKRSKVRSRDSLLECANWKLKTLSMCMKKYADLLQDHGVVVVEVITDNAGAMLAATGLLVAEYPHSAYQNRDQKKKKETSIVLLCFAFF
eukprot:PhM_4_TR15932/c1_g1_i13/m.153